LHSRNIFAAALHRGYFIEILKKGTIFPAEFDSEACHAGRFAFIAFDMDVLNKKIILASKSPRRRQLLATAGFRFEVKTKEVEEDYPETLPSELVASFLAEKKALACADFLQSADEILLASDSVVILDDVIYGKPADYQHAVEILRSLSGREHLVITGVCLLSKKKKIVFSALSKVTFDVMSDEEIEHYINTCQPFDKAGAYAIQEWIGLCKIKGIEGSYSNIMGLPMESVYRELKKF
jgi:septum formation protein